MNSKRKFVTIDEYVGLFPDDVQKVLQSLLNTIQEEAPDAVETISISNAEIQA